MIIKKIVIKENNNESIDEFSSHINLLYSRHNSRGKTTFLRILLHSLGFKIPSTSDINFGTLYTEIYLNNLGNDYIVKRKGDLIKVSVNKNETLYKLPQDFAILLSYLFKCEGSDIVDNLLGVFYTDQDRGWNSLERYLVIGSNRFDVEKLVRGLANSDVITLEARQNYLLKEKKKYTLVLDLQKETEDSFSENDDVFTKNINLVNSKHISYLNFRIKRLQDSLDEINKAIEDERRFYNYINSLKLVVQDKITGIKINVNSDNLINASEVTEYNRARRVMLLTNIEAIKREKASCIQKMQYDIEKNGALDLTATSNQSSLKQNMLLLNSVDQTKLKTTISNIDNELKIVKKQLLDKSKLSSKALGISSNLSTLFIKYCDALGVGRYISKKTKYFARANVQKNSGAIFKKIIFAFKLAILKTTEKTLGYKLFFLLDSPKSKELDDDNTDKIDKLIQTELSDNQVIVASLHKFSHNKIFIFDKKAVIKKKSKELSK